MAKLTKPQEELYKTLHQITFDYWKRFAAFEKTGYSELIPEQYSKAVELKTKNEIKVAKNLQCKDLATVTQDQSTGKIYVWLHDEFFKSESTEILARHDWNKFVKP